MSVLCGQIALAYSAHQELMHVLPHFSHSPGPSLLSSLPGSDIRLLYETLQGPRQCAERERQKLLVALARAELALQAATDAKAAARQQVRVAGLLCQAGE